MTPWCMENDPKKTPLKGLAAAQVTGASDSKKPKTLRATNPAPTQSPEPGIPSLKTGKLKGCTKTGFVGPLQVLMLTGLT